MTEFFCYAYLTWPEVAKLPRDTILVLPLGDGYTLHELAGQLGTPPCIGLLPSIPYGWTGSGLEVPPQLLAPVVSNLLDGLRQDGFNQVYVLLPYDVDLGFLERQLIYIPGEQPSKISISHALSDLSKVILIPVGHTEQHGYHLPLDVDTILIEAVSQGTTRQAPDEAACLPVMPYGVSTHRSAFAGTLNAGGRAFEDFYLGVIDALVERGVEKIYLLSGHGGSCSFLVNVVKYAGEQHPHIFCATAWLYLSGPQGIAALEHYRQSAPGGMGHACELETSLYLHLHPERAHMERVVDEVDFIITPSFMMDWVEGGALVANPPWQDDTATGSYGAGSLGTAEKGNLWLQAAIEEKTQHIHEIHEQQARRKAKRRSL